MPIHGLKKVIFHYYLRQDTRDFPENMKAVTNYIGIIFKYVSVVSFSVDLNRNEYLKVTGTITISVAYVDHTL